MEKQGKITLPVTEWPFTEEAEEHLEELGKLVRKGSKDEVTNEAVDKLNGRFKELLTIEKAVSKQRYEAIRALVGGFYIMESYSEVFGMTERYVYLYDVNQINDMMFFVEAISTEYHGGLTDDRYVYDDRLDQPMSFTPITEEEFLAKAQEGVRKVMEHRKTRFVEGKIEHDVEICWD